MHKNLVSASLSCKYNGSCLWEGGGALVPKDTTFASKMRQYYEKLVRELGDGGHMYLVEEQDVYYFYLEDVGIALTPLEGQQQTSSSSGGPRRGRRHP